MLVETTRNLPGGMVNQYRKCSNKNCVHRKSTWKLAGAKFTTDELVEKLLGQSRTVIGNPIEKRVFIVATTGNLRKIEVVEITQEIEKE